MSDITITLIKRNWSYWFWRLSNGFIPFWFPQTIEITVKEDKCHLKKCGYDLWKADYGRFIQTWWTVEVNKWDGAVDADAYERLIQEEMYEVTVEDIAQHLLQKGEITLVQLMAVLHERDKQKQITLLNGYRDK